MKLLGIELSSAVGSIALLNGAAVTARSIAEPRAQSGAVLPIVDELLADAGLALAALDGIAFGRGPGSFTGNRVAAAVAQGFALASGLPLLPVSSLLALAQEAYMREGIERSLVCVDARMGEIYFASFEILDGVAAAVAAERLAVPKEVETPWKGGFSAIGEGFTAYPAELGALLAAAESRYPELKPTAAALFPRAVLDHRAGRFAPAAEALPVYLREQTAWRRQP